MKRHTTLPYLAAALFFSLSLISPTLAQSLKLPAIISDHMLLQQNTTCPIWGQAEPNQPITVSINNQTHTTTADADGNWRIDLSPITTKGPFTLTITSSDQSITINDVITGEVWIGSGQSNMEWPTDLSINAEQELQNANYPDIRIFTVTKQVKHEKTFDFEGTWSSVNPKSIADFSAVAYYFGRELHQKLNTPVGLIDSSWGGTPAQSWTPYDKLKSNPVTKAYVDDYEAKLPEMTRKAETYKADRAAFEKEFHDARINLTNSAGVALGYHTINFNDADWKTATLPANYVDLHQHPTIDGVLWLRSTINLPTNFQHKKLTINLGAIDDYEMTYVNGKLIGQVDHNTPNAHLINRNYTISAELNNKPTLTIAVRIVDNIYAGGFKSAPETLYLSNSSDRISLANDNWKYKFGQTYTSQPVMPRGVPGNSHALSGLYNGMIEPLIPYAIQGVIWYQGEANAWDAARYQPLLTLMINSWREAWDQPNNKDFPFLIVQIANFYDPSDQYQDHGWAHLREAQRLTHLSTPNTGLATTIDIGEAADIHPRNKQDVGRRLAAWAFANTYNQPATPAGPIFTHQSINFDHTITLHFDHNQNLRPYSGDTLTGFFISSNGKNFLPANAIINTDNTITISNPQVRFPKIVAYGFAANPQNLNLTNNTNLPATPFRSDY
ncbi:Glycosyl hydrolases family 2, sugar binding domain [Poriferisphaera corsica]|uniref:Glycosyl hydrolases family 2, sugar binding domain n=1 Tax=Poriferisphaera corsica TaxID=2528020 RepID=A0A517YY62_9BACT|nr:sialate O-acetylesterase [Poriferisphaera corsica]QDU35170.1 Glycosyl hydrolases family 2, sugar binding domain [Poriferisphaera corsica]